MDTQEAYKELGLDPSVSNAKLKATWRRLVATWHPDRNGAVDAGRRIQLINKAYQHIRQLRDGNDNGADETEDESTEADSSTTAAGPDAQPTTNTHVHTVRLTLEEAILGCTHTLRGHHTHTCNACVGKGQRVLAKACGTCRGSGAVRKTALFGWLWNSEECADCGGDGRQRVPCDACEGSGELAIAYQRRVRFPAGLRAGHVLSVPSLRHGDIEIGLDLQVEIEPHLLFTLDDDGVLRCEMPVNGYAWMAGRWVDVPTPKGTQQLRLNRDALVYRLRGQGFPSAVRGPRGDYHVKVVPVFPTQEDSVQEALLDQLIEKSTSRIEADLSQPLGQWQQRMKRWNSSKKEQARDQ